MRCSAVRPVTGGARAPGGARRWSAAAAAANPARRPGRARAGAARSRRPPSGRRRGPGRRAGHRRTPSRSAVLGARAFGPAGLVPAVRPDRAVGMGACVVADEPQAVPQRGGRRAGRGRRGSDPVAVRWTWLSTKAGRDEAALEVDDLHIGKLLAPNVIAAEPGYDAATHRHCGCVGHGGAVHPPVEEEGRHAGFLGVLLVGLHSAWRVGRRRRRRPRRRCSHRVRLPCSPSRQRRPFLRR